MRSLTPQTLPPLPKRRAATDATRQYASEIRKADAKGGLRLRLIVPNT
jgi:hypothetical protein